ALSAAGARPQRPLWASTGTKDPSYPDTLYVDELVTRDTVNTMPEKTLNAVADHGRVTGDTVRSRYEDAWNAMAALKEAGIDYDDVVRVLEEEGVEKFEASWNELLATVSAELRKA
ncbi:transaldolase family protein, partial [Streptosporangium algeriense]